MTEMDIDEPVFRVGGPNWCFQCERPSDSEVTHINLCNYGGFLNVEYLCEEHLWDAIAEQEKKIDAPVAFVPR